ncbi:MAG TPA: GNAT family N-acetyltransferase [Pirellulales bacterium]|nr:GNAT family N-acetyltransferase [Pirellulales bacterium]
MSASLFDALVLSKPYFDREGLIVAEEDDRAVGFVHAGFGATEDESDLSHDLGVTCLLLTHPQAPQQVVGPELLHQSEAYLRAHGAKVLYAGGIQPLVPFYWGLYGGSEMPGILDSDAEMQGFFLGHGYRKIDQVTIFHRELAGFRPTIDRRQMQIRRSTRIEVTIDPPAKTWWEACTQGAMNRILYVLRQGEAIVARALFWDLQPLATAWGVNAQGLIHVEVAPEKRKQGLAAYLIGEALREMQQQGVTLVEAQAMQHNRPALGLYHRLGFTPIDQGSVLRKQQDD